MGILCANRDGTKRNIESNNVAFKRVFMVFNLL